MRRLVIRHLLAGASTLLIFPALCFAQFGAIAGVIKDDSGAVLPGVTVEAASPALIEKTRNAVSDGAGQYRVEQLRPGVYTVTFTLSGFSVIRREGIQISAGFTAPVNQSLRVSTITETITVTGEAPVVDVTSISEQKTLPKEALDALPTARSFATLGTTLPGVTANQRDVGGTQGERGNVLSAHGGSGFDMTVQYDGIVIGNMGPFSGSAWANFSMNDAGAQEMVFETGAISTEAASGGVRVNVIPRQGGNAFNGSLFGNFATRDMSRSNYTDALKARGARAPAGFDKLWDQSASLGGPIRRDRVWFFYAQRYRGNDVIGTDTFYEKNPNDFVYDPDPSRPLHGGGWDLDNQIRVTMQVTPRNRVSVFYDKINKCNCPVIQPTPTQTGESGTRLMYPLTFMTSGSWQSTISSRLLWDSALSYNTQPTDNGPQPEAGITLDAPISALETSTGRRLRAPFGFGTGSSDQAQRIARASLSYVTGSHSARFGMSWHDGWSTGTTRPYSDNWSYNLFNGVPTSVVLSTAPYTTRTDLNADMGIYAQDRWTIRSLTLTAGIRFDYFNTGIPAESAPASRWVGARSFAAIDDVPNWKDVSPRVGGSYDLFGNGKTAIKVTASRYVTGQVYAFTGPIDPLGNSVNTMTRTWSDTTGLGINGDFIPQGDPLNPLPNGEFLGTSNPNFGKSIVTTRYDPEVSEGWGKRPYNWEYSASVQHELMPRVSLDAGYYRRAFHNQTVTDNLDLSPTDFNEFCITAPTDTRLGSTSGSRICGLYDVTPGKAAVASLPSNQIIRLAKNYPGKVGQAYDGFDVTVNARPNGRLFLQAGVSAGRTVLTNCALVDNPMTLRFCEVTPPFLGQYRVSGGYTFPWGVQVSGVFQSVPTDPVVAATNNSNAVPGNVAVFPLNNLNAATVSSSLGRPIASAGGAINVRLIDPSTYPDFADRVSQLDLRISKGMRVGRYRIEAIADIYNVFNLDTILTYNPTYGPQFWVPNTVIQSAFVKLGGRLTF